MLPLLSLGLWHNFGGYDSYQTAREIVLKAFDHGITHFDLANNYGPPPGSAEETFGRILHDNLRPYRDELVISTKAGYRMWDGPYGEWGSKKYLIASLDQSLKRMGLDYVDIFYSHRPDPDTPVEETMEALAQAVQQGKALYAGISSYNPKQTLKALAGLSVRNIRCLVHQPSYSLLNRTMESKLAGCIQRNGLGCVVFSPLAQGILTGKYLEGIPDQSRAANPHGYLQPDHITEQKLQKVRQLKAIADQRGQSISAMALAWILHQPFISSVIVGCRTVSQLEENLECLTQLGFEPEELARIDQITL